MKKLLSLFGILGLLAFVATPIYAQEQDVALDVEERIVAEAEDVDAAVDEFNEEVEAIADDVVAEVEDLEEVVEDTADDVAEEATEEVEDFAALLNTEEVQNVFSGFTNEETAGIIGIFAGMGIAGLLVTLLFGILAIIALWKAFTRAGEAGWKAIIPIYNTYIQFKIAGMKNWFWYMILVAFVLGLIAGFMGENSEVSGILTCISSAFGGIVGIIAMFKFARKYGWGVFASVLFVLFYPICILVLGFGNYPYQGKSEETVVEA